MRSVTEWRKATVESAGTVASDVRRIVFRVEGEVPRFDPGSHCNIRVGIDGRPAIRTYTCIPAGRDRMSVAVKLHPQSRGGSRHMWSLNPGDPVQITLPENRFELSWRADEYLLLAGGIGVTPIYGMAKALAARNAPLTMHYGAQNRAAMAFADELAELLGERIRFYEAERGENIDLAAEIARLPANGEAYVCGPLGMLEAVNRAWKTSGRPVSRLRYEVFGDNGKFAEREFTVEVLNRGVTVTVPPDKTMLTALMEAGVDMVYDCQRGECGLCAVGIVEADGDIDHRDVFFSDEERGENRRMCSCVSRFTTGRALIDVGFRP